MKRIQTCVVICCIIITLFAPVGSIVLNQFGDHFVTLLRISSADDNGFAVSTASGTTVYIVNGKIANTAGTPDDCEMDFMVKDGRWYFFDEDQSFSYAVSKERDLPIEENTTVAFDAGNAADYETVATKYTSSIIEKQSHTVVCRFWRESVKNLLDTVLQVLFYVTLGMDVIFIGLSYILQWRDHRRKQTNGGSNETPNA